MGFLQCWRRFRHWPQVSSIDVHTFRLLHPPSSPVNAGVGPNFRDSHGRTAIFLYLCICQWEPREPDWYSAEKLRGFQRKWLMATNPVEEVAIFRLESTL
ncbi:unnamed protein product [Lactuca virosa]|uniref:Uncharacterized protein n=1 Tax=Lactuca virosa TaxID=75947 RepID=A0AAU9MCU3_9ASTR|nr:unnamed protein product [Lactuca virosa]